MFLINSFFRILLPCIFCFAEEDATSAGGGEDETQPGKQETAEPESNVSKLETIIKSHMTDGEQPPAQKEPEKKEKTPAPPEAEFDVTLDGKVVKVKQSDLIKGYMQEKDYTQKMQSITKQQEELAPTMAFIKLVQKDPRATEALVTFVDKILKGDDATDSDFVDNFLNFVTGKSPAPGQGKQPEQTADEAQALTQALSGIDPESEVGKALQLILKKNSTLEKKLSEIEGGIRADKDRITKAEADQRFQQQVAHTQKIYSDKLSALTNEKDGQYKFDTQEDKEVWAQLVRKLAIADNTVVHNDEEWIKLIDKHAKDAFDMMQGVGSRALAKHLKTQETPLPTGTSGQAGKKAPAATSQTGLSIQERIELLVNERKKENEQKG